MNQQARIKDAGHGPDLAGFDWADPLRLEDQLTEDERMLRDAARAFAEDRRHRASPPPIAMRRRSRDLRRNGGGRSSGVTIPEEFGGLGAGYVTYGLVAREVERCGQRLPVDAVGTIQPW